MSSVKIQDNLIKIGEIALKIVFKKYNMWCSQCSQSHLKCTAVSFAEIVG